MREPPDNTTVKAPLSFTAEADNWATCSAKLSLSSSTFSYTCKCKSLSNFPKLAIPTTAPEAEAAPLGITKLSNLGDLIQVLLFQASPTTPKWKLGFVTTRTQETSDPFKDLQISTPPTSKWVVDLDTQITRLDCCNTDPDVTCKWVVSNALVTEEYSILSTGSQEVSEPMFVFAFFQFSITKDK